MNEPRLWSPDSAHDEACAAWDDLYRSVIYFDRFRVKQLLESERSGKGIAAVDAADDAAAMAGYGRAFFDAVQRMIREGV